MRNAASPIAVAALTLAALAATPAAVSAADAGYGCFRVAGVSSINIRATAWSTAAVVATANRGEVLVKWKRYCAWRGFWCPVEKNGVKGHADKRYLLKVACP